MIACQVKIPGLPGLIRFDAPLLIVAPSSLPHVQITRQAVLVSEPQNLPILADDVKHTQINPSNSNFDFFYFVVV